METRADLAKLRERLGETPEAPLEVRPDFDPMAALRDPGTYRGGPSTGPDDTARTLALMPQGAPRPLQEPSYLHVEDPTAGDPDPARAREEIAMARRAVKALRDLEWRLADPPGWLKSLRDFQVLGCRPLLLPARWAWARLGHPGLKTAVTVDERWGVYGHGIRRPRSWYVAKGKKP